MSTDNFVAPVKRITNAFNYGIKLAERISKSASSAPAARALQILELVENLTNSLELASRATSEAYRQNVAACGQPFTKALVEDRK
ncbi:hypothetical protein DL95DRAFT_320605 [Leptodontidium sp. 2 PMI_412]|nr:hypothetical protein DL95DRAFT_320605 [Leptodontidium sp. 2 PMI_412]